MKRKNGRKYYPPLEFVPADVGPDGKVVVPDGNGNGVVRTESFKETNEERRKREAEEEKEEQERKVCVRMCVGCVYMCVCVCVCVCACGVLKSVDLGWCTKWCWSSCSLSFICSRSVLARVQLFRVGWVTRFDMAWEQVHANQRSVGLVV